MVPWERGAPAPHRDLETAAEHTAPREDRQARKEVATKRHKEVKTRCWGSDGNGLLCVRVRSPENLPVIRTRIVVWGASGHALSVCGILEEMGSWDIVGLVDDIDSTPRSGIVPGFSVLGSSDLLRSHAIPNLGGVIVAIGNNQARMRCAQLAEDWGYQLVAAVHPKAVVAKGVKIGGGTVISAGAVVNPAVCVGKNVIINTVASAGHQCTIEDGAHLGPGVNLGGHVRIGRMAWIGIGTSVRDRVSIGEKSVIGAGSVVLKNIEAEVLAYGSPAVPVKDLRE